MNVLKNKHLVDQVRGSLSDYDMYLALSEEAAELSSAAAKQARIILGNNPSPVTAEDGERHVLEELADVCVCANVLYERTKGDYVSDVMNKKLSRWVARLSESAEVTDTQMDTGYTDALNQVVCVGDVLYGNTDNKPWKVIGATPEHVPYTLRVQDKHGTTRNVMPKWMSHTPWEFGKPVTLRDGTVKPGSACYMFGEFFPVTLVSHSRDIACVKPDGLRSCRTVYINDLYSEYWDNYDKVADDIVEYKNDPEAYCKRFNLANGFEFVEKLDAASRMQQHLCERLQRCCNHGRT